MKEREEGESKQNRIKLRISLSPVFGDNNR